MNVNMSSSDPTLYTIPEDRVRSLEAMADTKGNRIMINSQQNTTQQAKWEVTTRRDLPAATMHLIFYSLNDELKKVCNTINAPPAELKSKVHSLGKAAATIQHREAPRLWAIRILGRLDFLKLFNGKFKASEARETLAFMERAVVLTKAMEALLELQEDAQNPAKKQAAERAITCLDAFQKDKYDDWGGIGEAAIKLHSVFAALRNNSSSR